MGAIMMRELWFVLSRVELNKNHIPHPCCCMQVSTAPPYSGTPARSLPSEKTSKLGSKGCFTQLVLLRSALKAAQRRVRSWSASVSWHAAVLRERLLWGPPSKVCLCACALMCSHVHSCALKSSLQVCLYASDHVRVCM